MFAQVNERRAYELNLTIPSRGLWEADAKLDTGDAFTATAATLTLAGLSLVGYVYRTGSYSGVTWVRLVGGFGGWWRTIDKKFYRNPFGLQLQPIVTDAANAVGEQVSFASNPTVGTFFVRANKPAVRVLNQLADSWYVLPSGVTHIGPRVDTTITSRFDVMEEQDLGAGRVTVATDFPEQWVPGCIFSAPTLSQRQASTVVHRLSGEKLRTEIWASGR